MALSYASEKKIEMGDCAVQLSEKSFFWRRFLLEAAMRAILNAP
jgi:hypothetical protein